ncbi:diphthine synthase [Candidatus Pacearchaeota archaeon]|nr:diphthine synthase [Candidatus Pacearchaeota archaeon]
MFYLIGLGLNEKGYSREAYDAILKSKKIYIEVYTVEFPYKIKDLEKQFPKKKFIPADREFVESLKILDGSKKYNIALLVYGSPLTATTHISLIQEAKKRKIKTKVIHSASILDAVAETGLQIYKFGKIASMPKWDNNFTPNSFIEIIKENKLINAHTLILIDIDLGLKDSITQLKVSAKDKNLKLDKIVICSRLGTKDSRIFYNKLEKLYNITIKNPFCIIIPGKLHFLEQEILDSF